MTRVLSLSSSRADAGILAPVWRAVLDREELELHILLTGMHCREGAPVPAVPDGATVHQAGADLSGEAGGEVAQAMAAIVDETAGLIAATAPDVLLALGDRLDMVPGVMASLPFNLPIVHLHGGEITEGAVDDRIRNAVSKLSHLHCVASEDARRRLLALDEEDWRITVTGAPGLDALLGAPEQTRSAFAREVGFEETAPFRLVTVHPETNSARPLAPLDAVLDALEAIPTSTLFTAPNSDPGGAEARRRIESFCAGHDWARFVDTLGTQRYASALRYAGVMLGNSSSGLIEAGLFGLPVINVGDRQAGRLRGANVIDIDNDADTVIAMLGRLGPCPVRLSPGTPYGDGNAAPRIADVLSELPERDLLLRKTAPSDVAERRRASPAMKADILHTAQPGLATAARITEDLRRLDIAAGDLVCLHASLSALGSVIGGPRAVIDGVRDAIGGSSGTLMMPCFSGDLSDPAEWRHPAVPAAWFDPIRAATPAYDPAKTPTRGLGVIAEYFRSYPEVRRSAHPQSSFAALGRRAGELLDPHPLNDRFGPEGPLGRLVELGGSVILLGAPYNTVSLFHMTQHLVGWSTPVRKSSPVSRGGETVWAAYDDIDYPIEWFDAAVAMLIDEGIARSGRVCEASAVVLPAAASVARIVQWRQEHKR